MFLITPRGHDVLNRRPSAITNAFLEQFAEFQEIRGRPRQDKQVKDEDDTTPAIEQTPLEHLEDFYQSIRTALASELLDKIKNAPAAFFEKLVVELLVAMGYGGSLRDAGQAIGQSGDEGIDGIIKEDKLGLDAVYIQAKRWGDTVAGSKTIREFVGSLVGQRTRKGVLITTSRFTKDALEFVNKIEQKVVLIDGTQLAQYMIDYNIGVVEQERYIVKKVDLDYFEAG